jgi:FkbM family methyltransferase
MINRHQLRLALANRVPALGSFRRILGAGIDSLSPTHESYSQHGEDRWIWEQIRQLDLSGAIYVDVGANHPSRISNTYLLYREGLHGVVIEPNEELLRLHRRFRPRDIAIGVGCGAYPRVAKFHVHSAPVTSSFLEAAAAVYGTVVVRETHLPILPLDAVLESIDFEFISLLSIDTEGLDSEVLAGGSKTLTRTHLVCVEVNSLAMEREVTDRLSSTFELIRRFECNLIWRNRSPVDQIANRSRVG